MGAGFRRLATALVLTGASLAGTCQDAGAAEPGAIAYAAPGPYAVAATLAEWQDAKRGRAVPVKIYAPKGLSGPAALVIFSHGSGGTREGGAMWGEHWASHGFVSVHVQHKGSDDGVWKPASGDKAAIAMSPNARNKRHLAEQFGEMRLPMLFLTGTADNSVPGDGTRWQDRTLPFRHASGPDKVLVVLDGADHMIFNGHALRRKETPRDAVIQRDVKALTLAFWFATLNGDAGARAWLMDGGAKSMLLASDQFQAK